MKGYREAVRWIALNDENGETDVEILASLISVVMVADLSGKEPEQVARAVLAARTRLTKGE